MPSERAAVPRATRRLARGAAFVFASSLTSLASLAGCGGDVESTPQTTADAAPDAKGDGATSDTGTTDTGVTTDTGIDDTGGVAPPYGLPADAEPEDTGGGMADYGAPPPPDAG